MNHTKCYEGISYVAWGYIFLTFNVNLGTINLMPDAVGYVLFLFSIQLLQEEQRDLVLLRSLCLFLAGWNGAAWLASMVGLSIEGRVFILELLVRVASLYFHFQLLTDLAMLAAKYQQPGDGMDRKLLRGRTIQTVVLTVLTLGIYVINDLPAWEWLLAGGIPLMCLHLFTGLYLMLTLFDLRRMFRNLDEVSSM